MCDEQLLQSAFNAARKNGMHRGKPLPAAATEGSMDMNLRNTALAAGAIAVLGAGLALAQPAPQGGPEQSGPAQGYQGYQGPPPGYQGGYQGNHAMGHHHRHAVL